MLPRRLPAARPDEPVPLRDVLLLVSVVFAVFTVFDVFAAGCASLASAAV